jgi:hypothetical protein
MSCRVQGHTDRKGKRKYNQDLSERRAAAVVREMVRLGIEAKRLASKGYGFDRPTVANDTDENRAKNRRVEFVFEMADVGQPTGVPAASPAKVRSEKAKETGTPAPVTPAPVTPAPGVKP